ncbi:hypothetical protein ROZALSC1DRAFT_27349, partial [Rozella allomycis CSF55]
MFGHNCAGKSTIRLSENLREADLTIYPCSYERKALNIVDTPGFEESKELNDSIKNYIALKVP